MRANIVIVDDPVQDMLRATGSKTKREAHQCRLVKKNTAELLALAGSVW
jgi:hypothetical protein